MHNNNYSVSFHFVQMIVNSSTYTVAGCESFVGMHTCIAIASYRAAAIRMLSQMG